MTRIAALLVALAAASTACAQDSRGWYLGGSVGQASYKHTCDGAPAGISCDHSDTAGRVFGGYQFKRNFAMEAAYHMLGTLEARGNGASQRADVSALDFTFVYSGAITNRLAVLARLGFYFGTLEATPLPAGAPGRQWETSRSNDITYGLGVSYDLTDRAELRAEWQHFGHMGTGATPALDIHLFSLGALYRF